MPSRKTKRRSSRKSSAQLEGIRDQLLAGDLDDLIEEYRDKPVEFLEQFGKTFPPKLRRVILDIFYERVDRAVLVACRGGGKSQLLSSLASALYVFKLFDVIMLGGSAEQSKNDYTYTSEILTDNPTIESFSEDVLTTVAESKKGNWLKCLACSSTATRGPHAGDPHSEMGFEQHGGCLMIDEECEAKDTVIEGSLYMVNTADPAVIIRASTFHKVVGTFATLMDNASDWNYTVYRWDCFDIAEPCTDRCEECFVEFAGELHPEWAEFIKKNPGFEPGCVGKARTSSAGKGWMKIKTIKQFFREKSWDDFEVEMLGRRPSASGLVLKPEDIDACIVPDTQFMPGMPAVIAIDWGLMGMATVTLFQEQEDHTFAIIEADDYHLAPDSVIYQRCVQHRDEYGVWEINADGSHPYQNLNLANDYGFTVTPVPFQKFKDLGAGWLKNVTEKHRLRIPKRFEELISQYKNWRKKDGKIVKDKDHYPDGGICAAIKWAETVVVSIEGQSTGIQRETVKIGNRF